MQRFESHRTMRHIITRPNSLIQNMKHMISGYAGMILLWVWSGRKMGEVWRRLPEGTHEQVAILNFGGKDWAAFRVCLTVNSESTLRRFLAQFEFRVCLGGTFNFREEAKGSTKMAASAANQSCSFNCKWQPPMEAAIFKAELHLE